MAQRRRENGIVTNGETQRQKVRNAYSEAARSPGEKHPFPVGRAFAENVGYPLEVLAEIPSISVDAYAGVSAVAMSADLRSGMIVLDLGCGAGLDSLIAAKRIGSAGRVVGVDFSTEMLGRARASGRGAGADNVLFAQASAENLPVASASVDAVLVNGIFNLNPFRDAIFSEIARVLRTGGKVFAAELVLREALTEEMKSGDANWFS